MILFLKTREIFNTDNVLLFEENIRLDIAQFENDIQQKGLFDKVEQDVESGIRSGVNSTLPSTSMEKNMKDTGKKMLY